jgi:hypothetical protein
MNNLLHTPATPFQVGDVVHFRGRLGAVVGRAGSGWTVELDEPDGRVSLHYALTGELTLAPRRASAGWR